MLDIRLVKTDIFYDRIQSSILRNMRQKSLTAVILIKAQVQPTPIELDDIIQAITKKVRLTDTVCILNNDEIGILLSDLHNSYDSLRVVEAMLHYLQDLPQHDRWRKQFFPAIGISVLPNDGDNVENAIGKARIAIQGAIQNNVAHCFYNEDLNVEWHRRQDQKSGLERALQRDEIHIHGLPVFNAQHEIAGLELLLRWDHPEKGIIPAEEFFEAATQMGLWQKTMTMMASHVEPWLQKYPHLLWTWNAPTYYWSKPPAKIFDDKIASLARTYKLGLEISESYIAFDYDNALRMAHEWKMYGGTIWIDDFGEFGLSETKLNALKPNGIKTKKLITSPYIRGFGYAYGWKIVQKNLGYSILNHLQSEQYQQGNTLHISEAIDKLMQNHQKIAKIVIEDAPHAQ